MESVSIQAENAIANATAAAIGGGIVGAGVGVAVTNAMLRSTSPQNVKIYTPPASPTSAIITTTTTAAAETTTTTSSTAASIATQQQQHAHQHQHHQLSQNSENFSAVSTTIHPASGVVVNNNNLHQQQQQRDHQQLLCSTPVKRSGSANISSALPYHLQQAQSTPFDKQQQNLLLLHTLREKLLTPGSVNITNIGLDELNATSATLLAATSSSSSSSATSTPTSTKSFAATHQLTTAAHQQQHLHAKPLNVIKNRYLVSSHRYQMSAAAAAKTPASYRHLIDMTSSHLRCTDIFTEQQFLCKIINEPLHKVQRAYYQLLHDDSENSKSTIYGHTLIRGVHDLVPLNAQRTYVIIAKPPAPEFMEMDESDDEIDDEENVADANVELKLSTGEASTAATSQSSDNNQSQKSMHADDISNNNGVDYYYEDLHTYIRKKRRLGENEARALFHQICQTVQVCHRNGVILRDLKLKRFYFIDEARTKLQYESLEGSMILDNPADDTLRDKIGCPLYTAPELLCPNTTYRGKPADMWSLGVLLYTMLVGQYPFYEKGDCSLITLIRICQVQIPSMLSRSVRWLLLALLRKNHLERMCAEQIFLTPWLREQRPYYMNIPANINLSKCKGFNLDDDESGDGGEGESFVEAAEVNIELSRVDGNHFARSDEHDDDVDGESEFDDDDEDIDEDVYDDDDDDDVSMSLNAEIVANSTHHQFQRTSREFLANVVAVAGAPAVAAVGVGVATNAEPLDYSCNRLQFNCNILTATTAALNCSQISTTTAAATSSSTASTASSSTSRTSSSSSTTSSTSNYVSLVVDGDHDDDDDDDDDVDMC